MLCEDFEGLNDELLKIDEQIEESDIDMENIDKAAYRIPCNDEGYKKILKERFGHDDFKEGQL